MHSNSKNILCVSHLGGLGNGGDNALWEQVKLLRNIGYSIVYAFPTLNNSVDDSFRSEASKINVTLVEIDYQWYSSDDASHLISAQSPNFFSEVIKRYKIDLILTNTSTVPWGAIAGIYTNTPHIWLVHEFSLDFFEYIKKEYAFMNLSSNKILAVSPLLKDHLIENGINSEKVDCFLPFADSSHIELANFALDVDNQQQENTKPRLVNVNLVHDLKNQIELVKAAVELKKRGIDFEVLLTGKSNDENYVTILKDLANRNNVKLSFTWAEGKSNWEDVRLSDIFVHTSRTETFGLTYIEALKLGVPTIASNTSASSMQMLGYLDNSNIYELSNINELSDKIENYNNNIGQVRKHFTEMSDKVQKEQTAEKCNANVITAIKETLGQNNLFVNKPLEVINELNNFHYTQVANFGTSYVQNYTELQRQYTGTLRSLDLVEKSISYKLGRILTAPLRLVRRVLYFNK